MGRREIEGDELAHAVERALVRLYDRDLAQHKEAVRFKWLTLALTALSAILAVLGVDWYLVGAVFTLIAGMGWLVGRSAWIISHEQIGELVSSLGESEIYVVGKGRDLRLTKSFDETPLGVAVGEWIRAPLPKPSTESVPVPKDGSSAD